MSPEHDLLSPTKRLWRGPNHVTRAISGINHKRRQRGAALVDTLFMTSALFAAVFVVGVGLRALGNQLAADFEKAENTILEPAE